MNLKKTTLGGMAVTLMFAVGCSSGGGGTATGGNGGTGGSGQGGSAGAATGGSGTGTGGSATGGSVGATGGTAGGGAGGNAAATGGAGGMAGGTGGSGTGGMGGLGGTGGSPPPPALAVPAGGTLSLSYHGSGVQIYTCTPSGGAGGAGGAGAPASATRGCSRDRMRSSMTPAAPRSGPWYRSRMDLQRRKRRQRSQGGAGQRSHGRRSLAASPGVVDDGHRRLATSPTCSA